MANLIYPKAKEAFLQGSINLSSADVRFILVDLADYAYNAAHDFLDDIPVAARVSVTAAGVGSKTFTDGTFDATDITFSTVTGDVSEAIVGYVHTGTEGTSRLLFILDTGVTGLPVTPNGGNINVAWNASGIFSL